MPTFSTRPSRLTRLLPVRHPLLLGPFGGGISSVPLAVAVADAGGLGSFGANHLDADDIRSVAAEIASRTAGPFALNLWIPKPGERELVLSRAEYDVAVRRVRPFYDRLGAEPPPFSDRFAPDFDDQVAALLTARPPAFSFIFGVPQATVLDECRRLGIVTIGTATNVDEVIALEQAGVDVIVASGAEAGGHRASWLRPIDEAPSLSALVPQAVDAVETPIVAAGGIADGRGIAAALALGADGVQVGTAFLTTDESGAPPAHRRALLSSPANRATVLTRTFSGREARGQRNRYVVELTPDAEALPPYPIQNWLTAPLRRAAAAAGDADALALWSGQNAPLATAGPARDVYARLVREADEVLARLAV